MNNDLFNNEKKNDWSCAELPLTSAEQLSVQDSTGASPGVVHIPFVLGAISIFHSVPGVTGLKLWMSHQLRKA